MIAKEELRQHAQSLEKLVEERTARLQEAVADLEHFSYTSSHDLRGPLRTLAGFSHVMLEDGCANCRNAESKDLLQRIGSGARRMNALISDALEYSKAAHGDLKLGPLDAGELIRKVVEDHSNVNPQTADIALVGEFPVVIGNETALAQCFAHLLSNAVKFVAKDVRPRVRGG